MAGNNPLDALNASAEEEERKAQEATKAFAAQMAAAANKPVAQPAPAPQAPPAYRTETYSVPSAPDSYITPNYGTGDMGGNGGGRVPNTTPDIPQETGVPSGDRNPATGGRWQASGRPETGVPIHNAVLGTGGGAGGAAGNGTRPPNTTPSTTQSQGGGGGGGAPPPPKVMPYEGPYIKQGAAWDDAKTAAYYKANPDVAKAVAAGKMEDAQSHYEKHGKQEGRSFAAAEAAKVDDLKAKNDAAEAAAAKAKADAAALATQRADVDNKNATGRAAAVAGLTPRISGVDRWGAQLVDFGGGNPQGVTLTDAELRSIASKAGYGYETVAEGWKNAGGKVGEDKSWAGMLDLPKTPAAGAAPAPFDSAGYLKNNPDVAAAIANGTFKGTAQDHYDQFGKKEVRPGGREATAGETEAAAAAKTFDSAKYLADNPDVAKAIANGTFKGNAFDHYWQLGRNEVRPGGRAFTPAEIAERDTWGNQGDGNPSNPMTPVPGGPSNPQRPGDATGLPSTPSTPPTTPGTKAADPRTDSYPPDDPNGIISVPSRDPNAPTAQGPVTGGINQGVYAPPYPVLTPQRSPEDYRGIRPPNPGDLDGNGNIWAAERGGGGRWVPYTPPTPPPVLPRNEAPLPPAITTGQNADSNAVVAGRLIEMLPGGADVWEYNDIENVVANRWTGERRPVPSASVGGVVGGIGPTSGPFERQPVGTRPRDPLVSIGGVDTMPERRMPIGGVNTMPFNPRTGLPYTPADFTPEPLVSIGGVGTMPERSIPIGGVGTMPAWSFDAVSGTITNNITGEVIKI